MGNCEPRTIAFLLTVLVCSAEGADGKRPAPAPPGDFLVGRYTTFDSGPFIAYEIFSVRPTDNGATIDRVTLTPGNGDLCGRPTLEVASASVEESVAELLRHKNPCSISDKALHKEAKRHKNGPVFSHADVVFQLACGGQLRRLPIKILDRDMFDSAPRTPDQTSWGMQVVRSLDDAVGAAAIERPAFSPTAVAPVPEDVRQHSPTVALLAHGDLDGLFGAETTYKLSVLSSEGLKPHAPPSVTLSSNSPVRPLRATLPVYPDIARQARVEGQFDIRVSIAADGLVSILEFGKQPFLFQESIKAAVADWRFSPDAAGGVFDGVIEFKMNCPPGAETTVH